MNLLFMLMVMCGVALGREVVRGNVSGVLTCMAVLQLCGVSR